MVRPSVLLLLCGSLLLPMTAVARLPGPLQAVPAAKVRDLSEIRSSRVLRVLVNQSRNSSGEVQGQAIGVEYHRLRAFEQYLNGHARDGQEITLKIIPKAKDQLLGALQRGEGDLVAPGELLDLQPGLRGGQQRTDCQQRAAGAGRHQGRATLHQSRTARRQDPGVADRQRSGGGGQSAQSETRVAQTGADQDRMGRPDTGGRRCAGDGAGRDFPPDHRRATHRRALGQDPAETAF